MDSAMELQIQNPHSYSDPELVELSQRGNQDAFAELVRRHRGSALKIATSILRDRDDAEDEVQNAMWKAFEHINEFQREAKFSTWLTRILVNQCLMRLRTLRRMRLIHVDEGTEANGEQMTVELRDDSKNAEQLVGGGEVARVLHEEIRRTPPLLRNVFVLRDVQQRPMPEVAEQLGISVAAAKSRLIRARAELRSRMSKHHGRTGPATLMA